MSKEERKFEIEDSGPSVRPTPPPALPPDEPEPDGEVDERTLAERTGRALPRHRDKVPPPADWPRDAFVFPLRRPGVRNIAVGAFVLVLLDTLAVSEAGRFPSWILKFVAAVFLLRGQLHVIAHSAAGHDEPTGWAHALGFDAGELKKYVGFVTFFALGVAPGWAMIAFGSVEPGIAVVAIGSMYASVVALGAALEDPSLKWPWKALGWMVRNPIACIAGSAGWWVLGLSEVALAEVHDSGLAVLVIVAAPLRVLGMYTLALSARAIGVIGRSWTG